jgi:transcriptional regulator with XRE-family HTH domain
MRCRLDVSQDFVTRDAGLSKAFYSQLENDLSIPSAETLEKLADVFGVTMDELWRGIGKCDPNVMDGSGAFRKRRGANRELALPMIPGIEGDASDS